MRREERVTVQGPVKEQQPDGMSHRGLAQGLGIRLFAFGGAYWPLAPAHSDPPWVRTCFGCVGGRVSEPVVTNDSAPMVLAGLRIGGPT